MGYWDTLYLILEYYGILGYFILDTGILWNTGYWNEFDTGYFNFYGILGTVIPDRILEYYGTLNTAILDTGHWNTMGYWLLGYLILDFGYFDYYGIMGNEILKNTE